MRGKIFESAIKGLRKNTEPTVRVKEENGVDKQQREVPGVQHKKIQKHFFTDIQTGQTQKIRTPINNRFSATENQQQREFTSHIKGKRKSIAERIHIKRPSNPDTDEWRHDKYESILVEEPVIPVLRPRQKFTLIANHLPSSEMDIKDIYTLLHSQKIFISEVKVLQNQSKISFLHQGAAKRAFEILKNSTNLKSVSFESETAHQKSAEPKIQEPPKIFNRFK